MKEIRTLSNGIKVIAERATQFNTVSLGIFINTGSAYETRANQGIAHMVEHMLFKGTKNRTALDISRESAALGDDVNAYTCKEYTVYYGTTLRQYFPRLLSLLSDMLTNSLFDENDIEKEKQIICEEIAMYDDSPEDLVHEKLNEAVWKEHPLGYIISGSEETVRSITRNQLLAFMSKYYTGKNIVVSVAGAFDEDVFDKLEIAFSDMEAREDRSGQLTEPAYYNSMLYLKRKIDQIHLNIAFPCITANSEERYTSAVFQAAFGGSSNSLLFNRIREELSLAYSVYSYNTSHKKGGLLQIDVTVNKTAVFQAFSEIIKLIEKVKAEGLTFEQVENFKDQVIVEMIMNNEAVRDKMELNAKQQLILSTLLDNDDQIAAIKRVSRDDVLNFARKYLDLSRMSVCIVGECPAKQIKQIEESIKDNQKVG